MKDLLELSRTALHTVAAYAWWAKLEISSRICSFGKTDRPENRNALILAWLLPPAVGVGVYRPTSFLKYGTELGWKMSAISGEAGANTGEAGQYLLGTLSDAVSIYRVPPAELTPSWRFFPRIDGGLLNAFATLRLASRTFKDSPPSVVIASGSPFHTFVAAYFIAKGFGAKLVLDYRDEWTEGTRVFVQLGNIDRFWEWRCLRSADAVFFATKSIRNLYQKSFPHLDTNRCQVLHNGWEPAEFAPHEKLDEALSGPGRKSTLSYVGHAGPHCLPGNFLDVLTVVLARNSDLRKRIQVRFIGLKSPPATEQFSCFENHMPGILDLVDYVAKRDAIRMMCDSGVLLLLNEAHIERALTAKLFEYLASGRPILVYGNTGEIGHLMRELKAGVMIPVNDPDTLEQALLMLENTSASKWRTPARDEFLKTHTREVLAKNLFDILERL